MLKIAVIEDNEVQSRLIKDYAKEWANKNNLLPEIKLFSSGEQFWFEFEELSDIDIVLLDIQMSRISGIELAKKIRKTKSDAVIIFITGIPDYMQEGYDVEALHYLLKPVKKEKLFDCLDRALKKQDKVKEENFVFSCEGRLTTLKQSEIVFIESISHNLKIKTLKSEYITRMNLSEAEEKLNSKLFVKTHRAFIANLMHIRQLQKDKAVLADNTLIPISRREYKNVNTLFIGFFTQGES